MRRFYFDVIDGERVVDKQGEACRDLAGARAHALSILSKKLRDKREIWTGALWTLVVRDETSQTVATLVFSAR